LSARTMARNFPPITRPTERAIVNRLHFRALVVLAAFCIATSAGAQGQVRWYRGNTHTHTINTDGDSAPDTVERWYKEHGYQFVVISDHDSLTPVDGLNASFGASEKFLVVQGEEVTDHFENASVHLIAINVREAVKIQGGSSVTETLERNAAAI